MSPTWKRLLTATLCVGVLVFLWIRAHERGRQPDVPEPPPEARHEEIPLPPLPDPEPPEERARGTYLLESGDLRVSLELLRGGRFRFLSTRPEGRRQATGTWSLAGRRLVLAYREIDGTSVGEEPLVVANEWRGRSIVLKKTGLPGPIVLQKRTVIRAR